eukprot:gene11328-18604_t
MADELAPPSKLACFFRTLLCARGSVTCTSDQDSDFPFSRNSIAPSPAATKAVAARSQESDPKWSNIVLNQSYTAGKGTGNECPTSLSPGAIGGEVDNCLYFPTSASTAPPLLLPTIEDQSPDPEQDVLWPSNNVSHFLAGAPSSQGEVRPLCIRTTPSGSSWEQSDRPASLEIQGANQQDKALGGTDCQLVSVSPTYMPPRGGRRSMQASTLNASKLSSRVKGLLAAQDARRLSTGQQVAWGNGLDVQNVSSALGQVSLPVFRRVSACHSMANLGRPELGQGVGMRSHNSVTVNSRSGPIFNRLSMGAVVTSMHGGVDTSVRRGSALFSPGSSPQLQAWQRKSTLIPRLQSGRVGKYLELLKQNSAAAAGACSAPAPLASLQSSRSFKPSSLLRPSKTLLYSDCPLASTLSSKGIPSSTPSNINTIEPQRRPVSAPLNKLKPSDRSSAYMLSQPKSNIRDITSHIY